MTLPRFPLGFTARMGYLGLIRADDELHRRECVVVIDGIRRVPEYGETEHPTEDRMVRTTSYPKGWEYHFVRQSDGDPDGWTAEAELLAKGYAPPA